MEGLGFLGPKAQVMVLQSFVRQLALQVDHNILRYATGYSSRLPTSSWSACQNSSSSATEDLPCRGVDAR
ncbi:hypothetical protein TNCV_1249641 [Trichonephila clavipes]|nr:hypothetical protein TNCV_1249641 [Trichonephila clavipes]